MTVTTADLRPTEGLVFEGHPLHRYTLHGRRVPSATEIVRYFGLGPDYSMISSAALEAAGARGRAFHQALTYALEDDLDPKSVAPGILEGVYSASLLLHNAQCEPLVMEQPMASLAYLYGGTPDLVCYLHRLRELSVVDYKTGETRGTDIQLSLYSWLVREAIALRTGRALGPEAVSLYCLRVRDGRAMMEQLQPIPDAQAQALVAAWHFIEGRTEG